ncbi:hypothetical protein HY449_00250 [Candidatus Pacearchaeota archaeon]|nr:hypothetical protein [Candidatus Pacearchaeota archaeon]
MASLVGRIINRVEWYKALCKNKPHSFYFLDKDKDGNFTYDGKVVKTKVAGEERELSYITLHDIQEFAIEFEMTRQKLLNGSDINAVYVNHEKWRRLTEYTGAITIQPILAEIPNSQ